jgi:opacity protein-like surface antigen
MWKRSLFVLALGLFSSHAFAQTNEVDPATATATATAAAATPSAAYIHCPTGQSSVFLYQSVTKFEVISSPRCDDRVDVLGRVDTLGGYLRVRTADGKEGYVPQDQITNVAPAKPGIAIAEPPPAPVPAGEGSLLTGPLSQGRSSFGYDIPRLEAFGGYSFLSADWAPLASRSGVHGWNGSAAFNLNPWLGVEGSATGSYQHNCVGASGLNCTILTFMGGPKITVHRGTGITAFTHGLVGLGSLTMSLTGSPLTWRDLAWAVGGGVDYAVTNRISVRVGQVDYLQTQLFQSLGGTHQNDIRASAGIVLRIGKVVTE